VGLNYLCAGLKKFYKHALPEVERIVADSRRQEKLIATSENSRQQQATRLLPITVT